MTAEFEVGVLHHDYPVAPHSWSRAVQLHQLDYTLQGCCQVALSFWLQSALAVTPSSSTAFLVRCCTASDGPQ
eukprot:5953150-Prorocentrum_lima.AAC.1